MVQQARLEQRQVGLTPVSEGWFVVSIHEAAWMTNSAFGDACVFEGDQVSFPEVGFTLAVLQPGQPNGLYHRETKQEDFLVLSGECVLLIEDEERPLKAGDFVHCPADTEHIFVGAGDRPCVIFMTGARTGRDARSFIYPRSELALAHGAGVEVETASADRAYAAWPDWVPAPPSSRSGPPWE